MADRLVALAQRLLEEQGITWQDILYVGVACPGQIDRCVCLDGGGQISKNRDPISTGPEEERRGMTSSTSMHDLSFLLPVMLVGPLWY